MSKTKTTPYTPIEIGLVSSQYLLDTPGDTTYTKDQEARDTFEQIIASVPAPDPSLNKASGSAVIIDHAAQYDSKR